MTRFERIRNMGLGEMADALIELSDGRWCPTLPQCLEDMDKPEGIPEERCHNCVVGWLLGETEK